MRILVSILACFIVIAFCTWYTIGKPLYYNNDGTIFWESAMTVTKKETLLAYPTVYTSYWNGSILTVNNVKIAEIDWVEVVLWNGFGIQNVKVIVPSNTSSKNLVSLVTDIKIVTFNNNRGNIVKIRPPKGKYVLEIIVTDTYNNITRGTINLIELSMSEEV